MAITVTAKDVMDNKVYYVDEQQTAMAALIVMTEKNVWSIVVTKAGLPIGVVTERDILRRVIVKGFDINKVKVGDICSSPLLTINKEASAGEVLGTMAEKEVRRLYIIEDGKIIGRVTQTEMFKSMLNVLKTIASLPHRF